MNLCRRAFVHALAGTAALPCVAAAAAYPTRPVHLFVDLSRGLAPDVLSRLTAAPLSQRLSQQIIVENKPGAAGNVGAEYVIGAAADGYTLLTMISDSANAALYPNLDFNFVRGIAPVAFLGYSPFVVVVNPAVPVRTMAALVAYARANPGRSTWPRQGSGPRRTWPSNCCG